MKTIPKNCEVYPIRLGKIQNGGVVKLLTVPPTQFVNLLFEDQPKILNRDWPVQPSYSYSGYNRKNDKPESYKLPKFTPLDGSVCAITYVTTGRRQMAMLRIGEVNGHTGRELTVELLSDLRDKTYFLKLSEMLTTNMFYVQFPSILTGAYWGFAIRGDSLPK